MMTIIPVTSPTDSLASAPLITSKYLGDSGLDISFCYKQSQGGKDDKSKIKNTFIQWGSVEIDCHFIWTAQKDLRVVTVKAQESSLLCRFKTVSSGTSAAVVWRSHSQELYQQWMRKKRQWTWAGGITQDIENEAWSLQVGSERASFIIPCWYAWSHQVYQGAGAV